MSRLTRVQINKAINGLIKAQFTGIPIQSSDVKEGFQRPSFSVTIETRNAEAFGYYTHREMTCRILFFPTDQHKYKEEAYDVMDRLENLFGLSFSVSDRVIMISNAESDTTDGVVYYDFNFDFYDEPIPDGSVEPPLMGELNIKNG